MKKTIQMIFILSSAILFTACSQKTPEANRIIEDPSILKPVPNKENVFYYLNKKFDANNYNKVYVPKIDIVVEEDDKKDIDKELLNKISTYLQENLQKELTSVLANNTSNNTLKMEMAVTSFDVSYKNLKPWELMPYGLAIKVIMRGTGLEKRKLNISLAFKLSDEKTSETQILIVDFKTRDDMPSYDELTFQNVKPLLDYWIKNSKVKLTELNNHKYKY
mgnify:CR=1 FL=1